MHLQSLKVHPKSFSVHLQSLEVHPKSFSVHLQSLPWHLQSLPIQPRSPKLRGTLVFIGGREIFRFCGPEITPHLRMPDD
jgi:hypothetical protein